MTGSSLTLQQAVELYGEYLIHEQRARPTTRVGYRSGLNRFYRFVAGRCDAEPLLAEVGVEEIRQYLYHLSRRGLRPRTLRGALYPVRGLFRLAVERGYVAEDPTRGVRLPKKDAAVRPTVSDEELEQLLKGCAREPDLGRRRMVKALLAILVYGGLRRSELLDLQIGDVDLVQARVTVRNGKGGKARSLFVCEDCVQAVRDWLAVRPKTSQPFLFLTDRRRRLGEVGLAQIMAAAKSLADLRDHENIKPHAIRHAAATRLLRNGADLRSIQHFLGHNQLQTTAIYLHTDEQQLQRMAECTALRDRSSGDANLTKPSAVAAKPSGRCRSTKVAAASQGTNRPLPRRTDLRSRNGLQAHRRDR
jgi:site-specific recombinase XerD